MSGQAPPAIPRRTLRRVHRHIRWTLFKARFVPWSESYRYRVKEYGGGWAARPPWGPAPTGPYAGGERSPIVWVWLCPRCAGYAPGGEPRLSGRCQGCGGSTREIHRFAAYISSVEGCSCNEHNCPLPVSGDLDVLGSGWGRASGKRRLRAGTGGPGMPMPSRQDEAEEVRR